MDGATYNSVNGHMSWLTIAIYQSSVSGMNRSYIEKGLEIPCQYLGDLYCL